MKKVVLKLEFADEKIKQKAMKNVSGLSGVESIAMDKDKKLTVTGDIDPVTVVAKLRKLCHTEIVSVGPAKEPEKKKEEPKKEEPKKEEPKKADDKKKDGPKEDQTAQLLKAYQAYHQQQNPYYYYYYNNNNQYQPYQHPSAAAPPSYFVRSVEEEPNGCVIC